MRFTFEGSWPKSRRAAWKESRKSKLGSSNPEMVLLLARLMAVGE